MLDNELAKMPPAIFAINNLLQEIARKSLISVLSLNNQRTFNQVNDISDYFITDTNSLQKYDNNASYMDLKELINSFKMATDTTVIIVSLTNNNYKQALKQLLMTLAQKLTDNSQVAGWQCQLSETHNQNATLITLLLTNNDQPQIIYSGKAIASMILGPQLRLVSSNFEDLIIKQLLDKIRPLFSIYTLWHADNPWQYYQRQIQPVTNHEDIPRLKQIVNNFFKDQLTKEIAILKAQTANLDYEHHYYTNQLIAKTFAFNDLFKKMQQAHIK